MEEGEESGCEVKTIKYDPPAGTHVKEAARDMIILAMTKNATVECKFNDIPMTAVATESVSDVVSRWDAERERQHQAYIATPEYKERQLESERKRREVERRYKEAIAAAPKGFRNVNPVLWQDQINTNKDPYGARIITYADEWARIMEVRIEKGATVAECADECSHIADYDGITGFMYGAAVAILASCWEYGDQLRRWHNKEWGAPDDTKGTVNPSLITLVPKAGTQ